MNSPKKISTKLLNGTIVEYNVVLTFFNEQNNKHYVIYTDNTLDDEGNIYVGGTDEFGVFLADGLGGLKYENLSIHVPASYRHFGEVWHLQVAKDKLYIQTRHYIFIYKKGEGIEVIDPGAIIYESLVWEGNLYVATSRDLYVQSGGRLHALRGAESLHNIVVCGLFPYGKEGMMIATDFHGLFLYDGKSVKPFRTDADEYIKENPYLENNPQNNKKIKVLYEFKAVTKK